MLPLERAVWPVDLKEILISVIRGSMTNRSLEEMRTLLLFIKTFRKREEVSLLFLLIAGH